MSSSPLNATAGPDGDEAGTDKRRTLVAVGALAVVALGAGGWFLLGGTGAEEPTTAAAPAAAAPAAPAADAAAAVAATLPTPTDVPLGRNPFKVPGTYIAPVVVASPVPDTGTGGTGTSTGGTGTGGTSTGTTPGTSTGTTPGTSPGTTPGTSTGTGEEKHKLILLRVFGEGADQSASFSIHGTEQVAKVGSIFGPTAEILLLELTEAPAGVWTATLQVGDGDPFDVVMGEPAYVR